jgi:hypothetical protein
MNEPIDDHGQGKKGGKRRPRGGRRANEEDAAAAIARVTAAKTPWHEHKVAIIAITTLFTVLGGISIALFNSWRAHQESAAGTQCNSGKARHRDERKA